MSIAQTGNQIMESLSLNTEKYKSSGDIINRKYSPYKLVMLMVDVLLILVAFGLAARIDGIRYDFGSNINETLSLLVFVAITGSFFLSYNLYSYHLIFFARNHMKSLLAALSWSFLTISLIFSLYAWPQIIDSRYFVPLLFLFAAVLLLLSRFFYEQLLNILKIMGISFLATGFISLISPDSVPEVIARPVVVPIGFSVAVVLLLAGRYFIVHVVFNVWMRRHFRRQIAIIGSDEDAINISNHVLRYNAPFWINGTIGSAEEMVLDEKITKRRLGELIDLPDIVSEHELDALLITDEHIDKATLISIIDFCTTVGTDVWFPPKLMPIIEVKLFIDHFCGIPMIRLSNQKYKWVFDKIKHALDALITLPSLILLSPLFLLIAIAIKIDSKGPVFYKARAIGKGARMFFMYKFRSMCTDSDSKAHQEYVTKLIKGEIGNGGDKKKPLKITDDPRVTRVGKILRKLSLDELPQLINVAKGDMSLVGPRPCLPYEYEIYKDWHKKRTTVRPGITGLWQVSGRSEVVFDDMILLDLYYIYNHNLVMDYSTIYETIYVVLGKKGAY